MKMVPQIAIIRNTLKPSHKAPFGAQITSIFFNIFLTIYYIPYWLKQCYDHSSNQPYDGVTV